MITPIDIALLGVVLAAVALVILRRRSAGAADAGAFRRAPREAPVDSGEPGWSEAAATLAPVREPEAPTGPGDEPGLATGPPDGFDPEMGASESWLESWLESWVEPSPTLSELDQREAIASLRRVDGAGAQDDPASARRILGSIDPSVLKADAGLRARAGILLNRIRLTESHLAATALAEAGRYGEARGRMLALAPSLSAISAARAEAAGR